MRIVIDGMGGDNAPMAPVAGSIEALKIYNDLEICLTGPEDKINEELSKYDFDKSRIKVINTTEVISTNEHPVKALRRKKDSSLVVALNLVKDKEYDAVISAGSTGAFLAGCTLIVGRIKGIERPALGPIMPGKNGPFMVIDSGANVDCKPNYLLQFGKMGKVYCETILNEKKPKVGLINIGEEEAKGNELTKAAYALLKENEENFCGNVEPRDIPNGDVQVLVCDGFVGNTVLKMYEGVASTLLSTLKEEIMSTKRGMLGGLMIKPAVKGMKKRFDYKEYGGAPFLGVDGICVKAHGSSDKKAFKNAIRQAVTLKENNTIQKIKDEFENCDK